jgi:hypothetical protein
MPLIVSTLADDSYHAHVYAILMEGAKNTTDLAQNPLVGWILAYAKLGVAQNEAAQRLLQAIYKARVGIASATTLTDLQLHRLDKHWVSEAQTDQD